MGYEKGGSGVEQPEGGLLFFCPLEAVDRGFPLNLQDSNN